MGAFGRRDHLRCFKLLFFGGLLLGLGIILGGLDNLLFLFRSRFGDNDRCCRFASGGSTAHTVFIILFIIVTDLEIVITNKTKAVVT